VNSPLVLGESHVRVAVRFGVGYISNVLGGSVLFPHPSCVRSLNQLRA
jgi:hypothetical protein